MRQREGIMRQREGIMRRRERRVGRFEHVINLPGPRLRSPA
jgi:hypothetical protein